MYIVTAPRQTRAALPTAQDVAKRFARGLLRLLRGVAGRVAEFLNRQATRQQLYEMSDYQLADMGLSRGQIGHVFDSDFQNFEQVAVPEHAGCVQEPQPRATVLRELDSGISGQSGRAESYLGGELRVGVTTSVR